MESFASALAVTLLNDLGLFAVLVLAYGIVLRRVPAAPLRSVAIGLLFAVAAIASMLKGVHYIPGLMADSRNVVLALAAPFGGWPAALVAGTGAGAFRLLSGGPGALAGTLGIVLAAAAGLAFVRLARARDDGSIGLRRLLLLGVLTAASILSFLALPWPLAQEFLGAAGWQLTLMHVAGTVLLGTLLSWERVRTLRERRSDLAARTDPLTGLANRRAFLDTAQWALRQAERHGTGFAVLLIDCDHFKSVNDTHGHDAGDRVLREMARVMTSVARESDLVARFGGEEFVALLPAANLQGALNLAERLRAAAAATAVEGSDGPLRVTVSIGACAWEPGVADLPALLAAADAALYRAKRNGRDRVEPGFARTALAPALAAE